MSPVVPLPSNQRYSRDRFWMLQSPLASRTRPARIPVERLSRGIALAAATALCQNGTKIHQTT
jgi:hypothetical protein